MRLSTDSWHRVRPEAGARNTLGSADLMTESPYAQTRQFFQHAAQMGGGGRFGDLQNHMFWIEILFQYQRRDAICQPHVLHRSEIGTVNFSQQACITTTIGGCFRAFSF